MSNRKIIPIVFASNNNYVPYLGVALYSLIKNSSEAYQYNVYIFYTDITNYNQKRLERMETENVKIKCVDVTEYVKDKKVKIVGHFTIEAIYRLIIPYVIPQYDKVLYFDSDLVINRDVAELYNEDIGNNVIGAVRHIVDLWFKNYIDDKLKIPYSDCFNSGVLLINTKRFRDENIMEKFIKLISGDIVYYHLDQDALNILCRGNTYFLDNRWNVCWHFYFNEPIDEYKDIFYEAAKEPFITHFTSYIKPWLHPEREMADYFWKYARQTSFYEEILYRNISTTEKQADYFKSFLFPFDKVARGSNIVLYAAGGVGKAYYHQIKITGYCNVLLWVDRDYKMMQKEGFPVYSPEKIREVPYDYILIAINSEMTAESIKKYLIKIGVPEYRIIWADPIKYTEGCGKS